MGPAVSELFNDERLQIRQLIEQQIRGSQPGAMSLPVLHRPGGSVSSSGSSLGSGSMSGSMMPDMSDLACPILTMRTMGRLTSRRSTPAPPQRMSRKYAVIIGALVALVIIAGIAVWRTRAPQVARQDPAPKTASPLAAAAAPPPTTPAASSDAPSVRGVTDDSITVGMSAAFSGASRELGNRMKLGIETAFATINESGGVSGRQSSS